MTPRGHRSPSENSWCVVNNLKSLSEIQYYLKGLIQLLSVPYSIHPLLPMISCHLSTVLDNLLTVHGLQVHTSAGDSFTPETVTLRQCGALEQDTRPQVAPEISVQYGALDKSVC